MPLCAVGRSLALIGCCIRVHLLLISLSAFLLPCIPYRPPVRSRRRLTAEDVMNSHVRYLYPITRVRSVEQLLRTTAHSAFPIVTPVGVETIPERPTNVSTKHTPQLYSRESFIGETDPDSDSDWPGESLTLYTL